MACTHLQAPVTVLLVQILLASATVVVQLYIGQALVIAASDVLFLVGATWRVWPAQSRFWLYICSSAKANYLSLPARSIRLNKAMI